MYCFVIKIAILVNKAEELVNTIPMLGVNNDIVDVERADPDPINLSVINNITFFLFKDYIYSYNIHCQSYVISKNFPDHAFQFCILNLYFHHPLFLFLKVLDQYSKLDMYSIIKQKIIFHY